MKLPKEPTPSCVPIDAPFRTSANMLIHKAAVRRFLLDWANQSRHHKFARVAPEVIDEVNGMVRRYLRTVVARNPSCGKTIR